MWSARQSRKMGRRVAGLLGGLLVGLLLIAAPAAAAFVDPINLSNSSAVNSGRPAIAVNEVNGTPYVFAVWEEGINGQTNIVFARSQSGLESCGGLQFGAPRILSAGPGASMPAVAANDSGGVFVVWQASSQIWFSRSINNGETFEVPVNLSQTTTPSNFPSVAADLGGVFVAWSNGSFPAQTLFRRSLNSGATNTFGPPTNLSLSLFVNSGPPSVAAGVVAGEGSVFLAWEERSGTTSSIRYKKFGRGADPVTGPVFTTVLSNGLSRAFSPNLAFGDGSLSVTFVVDFNTVYHRSSSDGTRFSPDLFLPPENLSGAVLFASNARGARGKDSAMVAWAEMLDPKTASFDLRHRLLGTTTGPQPVLTTAAGRTSPAAAIDSTGRLLVAWQGREPVDLLKDPELKDEVYVSHSGGTGGEPMTASVEMTPQTLNAKTMYQGEGVFTLRIRPLDGNAAEIDPLSLKFNDNEKPVTLLRWNLVDTDGNGSPDTLEVKIRRSELGSAFSAATLAAADRDGNYTYTVKGNNMTGRRCFSSPVGVRIIHQ